MVSGKSDEEEQKEKEELFMPLSVVEHVNMLIESGLEKKDAIKEAAKQRGISKRDVYNEYERG